MLASLRYLVPTTRRFLEWYTRRLRLHCRRPHATSWPYPPCCYPRTPLLYEYHHPKVFLSHPTHALTQASLRGTPLWLQCFNPSRPRWRPATLVPHECKRSAVDGR